MALDAAAVRVALERIQRFRADPECTIACPVCETPGLLIEDRSTRPYAEWYHLACRQCGLDETIHIPLAPPVMGGFD